MWNIFLDKKGRKSKCKLCGKENENISNVLKICLSCIRNKPIDALKISREAHHIIRDEFHLPKKPPMDKDGIKCNICINECKVGIGKKGYCGLRKNVNGKLLCMKVS